MKIRDYNSHSSNNVMPCLFCVDETGIETNPICFESHLSAPLNMPTSVWPSCVSLTREGNSSFSSWPWWWNQGGGRQFRVAVQCLGLDTLAINPLTSEKSGPDPVQPLPPTPISLPLCNCCHSNPLPLLSSWIWLLAAVATAGAKRPSASDAPRFRCTITDRKKGGCADRDDWIDIRGMYLFMPDYCLTGFD